MQSLGESNKINNKIKINKNINKINTIDTMDNSNKMNKNMLNNKSYNSSFHNNNVNMKHRYYIDIMNDEI